MVGRVGSFEKEINGKFTRMKEAKKTDVRLFYEKGDGTVLCYGDKAWKEESEGREKPIKGWMIGWFQEATPEKQKDGKNDLYIAARCPIADSSSTEFKWEVRDENGDFVEDPQTQLVLTGEAQKQERPVKLDLASEVGLYPTDAKADEGPAASPLAAQHAAMMAAAMQSPYGMPPFGFPFGFPPQADWNAQKTKGKKNKKGRGAASPTGGLRADAPAFVPGAPAAAAGAGYPMPHPMFPFLPPFGMPGMPGASPADLARITQRATQSINAKYAAEEKPQPEAPKPVQKKGLKCTETKVLWELKTSKEAVLKCTPDNRESGVSSPTFRFTKDGQTGPEMCLTLFPFGHQLSSQGFISIELKTVEQQEVKLRFQFSVGPKVCGAKALMGNKFHADFARSAVFKVEEGSDTQVLEFDDSMEIGVELLAWI